MATSFWDVVLKLVEIVGTALLTGIIVYWLNNRLKQGKRIKIARDFYKYVKQDDMDNLFKLVRFQDDSREYLKEMLKVIIEPSETSHHKFLCLLKPELFEFNLHDENRRSYIRITKPEPPRDYYFHEPTKHPSHDPQVKEAFLEYVRDCLSKYKIYFRLKDLPIVLRVRKIFKKN
jgi:hypothetical protein